MHALLLLAALIGSHGFDAKADQLGMLDSPVAFVFSCAQAFEPIAKAEQKELDASSAADQESYGAIRGMAAMACAAVVRGVAETVATAAPYKTEGGTRVCIDPAMRVDGFMREAVKVSEREPEVYRAEGLTTPGFVLYVLHTMSKCPK